MRIIAGDLKGRTLRAPTWPGLRPTSDKLRETLFNVVAPRIEGARVLDLYAGTGAIGIEALSRGARHATFVDGHRRAIQLIEENLRRCGVTDRYAIIRLRLPLRLDRDAMLPSLPAGSFDLAVLDPPYDELDLAAALAGAEPRASAGGLVILEHAKRREAPRGVGRCRLVRDLTSGDSALAFYEVE